jgi:hypothetical protein
MKKPGAVGCRHRAGVTRYAGAVSCAGVMNDRTVASLGADVTRALREPQPRMRDAGTEALKQTNDARSPMGPSVEVDIERSGTPSKACGPSVLLRQQWTEKPTFRSWSPIVLVGTSTMVTPGAMKGATPGCMQRLHS